MQSQGGPSGGQVGNFKILPAHASPPTRSDGFHGRLFGCEAPGITLITVGLPFHIGDLAGGVNALGKALTVTVDGLADASDLSKVHARAQDHFSSAPEVVIVRRPCLTPLVLISASAIFLTAPALPRTTSTSRQLSWSRCTCIVERIERWWS